MEHQLVSVIDFGGQYTQLIVRRVRELGCYSEMVPWQSAAEHITTRKPQAVILSGGPKSTLAEDAPDFDFTLVENVPVLAICYGQQLMAKNLGGEVQKSNEREYGRRQLHPRLRGSLAESIQIDTVWMSHGDKVTHVPPGFIITASTESCPVAAMENSSDQKYGVQFHPEVTHTPDGRKLLQKFLLEHAKLKGDWTPQNFIDDTLKSIRETVGTGKVLCAVSGGVDSSVVAALLAESVGEQTTCVFVDHGLLRKGESEQVHDTFTRAFHPNLIVINAHDQFFGELKGVTEPEQKRKIIGENFVVCFERNKAVLQDHDFLAQGTLYPDVIESGSPTASKIKTHHNVGGLPDWMKLKVIEPLRWLFKDEVREVGRALGLSSEVVDREPFPGPGLGVRILGEVTPERVKITQDADWIFREELLKSGLNKGIWQSYAALLDVRSVGVMGDERTYEQPIVLRAVTSEDAMTAQAFPFAFEFLELVAQRIVNEVDGVNRVLYDLTSKPPATIEWE